MEQLLQVVQEVLPHTHSHGLPEPRRGRFIRDYEERSRPLVRADELRRVHPRRQLLLVRPYQPVLADKIIYFEDSFFAGRFDANPYITPVPNL